MNNNQCHVYCLFRPHEGTPFYFGRTQDIRCREADHKRKHGRGTYFCLLHTFKNIPEASACELEYIQRYKAKGIPILNKDSDWTPEARAKKSRDTKEWWASQRARTTRGRNPMNTMARGMLGINFGKRN